MEIHYVGNLHYYTRDCCYCSLTGCPSVKPMRLYKVGGILCQKHQNLKPWLAFGVLALALLKFV